MPSPVEVHDWHERDVVSSEGERIGKLADVYVDDSTGEPEFLLVTSGFLGHSLHLVPAEGAALQGEDVRVAFDKATIESAPNVHADNDLSLDEERKLFEHYGRTYQPREGGVLVLRRFVLIARR